MDVVITEILKLTVPIDTDDPVEAEQIASDNWHNSKYILDADCFVDVEFHAKEKN